MAGKEKSTIITAFVLDFETGGLKCDECAATQLSVHAVRIDNFEVMDTYNEYFYPYKKQAEVGKPKRKVLKSKFNDELDDAPLMEYSKKAESVSGITMDLLYNKGVDLDVACGNIIDFFRRNTFNVKPSCKPFLVGQNILFDLGFMQQIMMYTNKWKEFTKCLRGHNDFFGNFQPYYVDTIVFSQLALSHTGKVDSWSLGNLAEIFNIDLDDAHDADADVVATREVLRKLTVRMRNENEINNNGSTVMTEMPKTRKHFKI